MYFLKTICLCCGVLVSMICSTVVFAQNTDKEPVNFLNQIQITGSRNENISANIPVRTDVIFSQQVDEQLIDNTHDLTRYIPGVSVSGSAGDRFGLSGFSIRGIGGDRVKILVDGINQANDYKIGPFLNSRRDFFEVETLKAVEFIRGPASALYGSDAMGGVIGYRTKDPNDFFVTADNESHASVKSEYQDSSSTFKNTLNLANRNGDLESLLIYTHRDGNERKTHSGADITGSDRKLANPADSDSDNVLLKFDYNLNSQGNIRLALENYQSSYKSNNLSELGVSRFTGFETTSNLGDDDKDRQRISVEYEHTQSGSFYDRSLTRLGWQDTESTQITHNDRLVGPRGGPLLPQQRFRDSKYDERLYSLDLQFEKNISKKNHLTRIKNHFITYGLDFKQSDNKNLRFSRDTSALPRFSNNETVRDFPKSQTNEYSAYIQDYISFDSGNFTLIPGLRYDYYRIKPSVDELYLNNKPLNLSPGSINEDNLSLKLGGIRTINDNWSIFGQYAEGFKSPQSDQIFGEVQIPALGYQVIANPDLKPETSRGVDIGLRLQNNIGNFELTGFYNNYDSFIEQILFFDNVSTLNTFQFQNRDEVNIKGLEFKGDFYLDRMSDKLDGFILHTSAAYGHGEIKQDGQADIPLNSVSPLSIVAGLHYSNPNNRYGGEFVVTAVKGKSRVEDEALFKSPGFTIADMNFYYKLTESLRFNAGIFNITDKKYWLWADVAGRDRDAPEIGRFIQPGRNYAVSLSWIF